MEFNRKALMYQLPQRQVLCSAGHTVTLGVDLIEHQPQTIWGQYETLGKNPNAAKSGRKPKERCARGHELTAENLIEGADGRTRCKKCRQRAWGRQNEKRTEQRKVRLGARVPA